MVEEGGVTEVATWNDNGSSYTTEGDKGIMILACMDDVDADSTDSVYVRYRAAKLAALSRNPADP